MATQQPQLFGPYQVLRRLALGGMGEIYLGRQRLDGGADRLVILKTLLPEHSSDEGMLTQFHDEARIVACIRDENVVTMFEVGEHAGTHFMAMEYVNGVDLATLQKAGERAGRAVPLRMAAVVARDAAKGLDAAHRATDARGLPLNVVHRDVSPQNIMVRADGRVKVLDFGVAFAEQRATKTDAGMLKGKVGYMAPEQIQGEIADARSDQFSLGIVLWEMLAGRRLFKGDNHAALFKRVVSDDIVPPSRARPEVPPELDALVMRMLEREPARRFASCREVAAALDVVIARLPGRDEDIAAFVEQTVGARLKARLAELTSGPQPAAPRPSRPQKSAPAPIVFDAPASAAKSPPSGLSQGGAGSSAKGPPDGAVSPSPDGALSPSPAARRDPRDEVDLGEVKIEIRPVELFPVDDISGEQFVYRSVPRASPSPDARIAATVLWVRVPGLSRALSPLPPSQVRRVVDELWSRVQGIAAHYGGSAAPLTDTTGVAVFGPPTPRQDDADRALRCALDLPRVVEDLDPELDGLLDVRVAAASGEAALVGADGSRLLQGAPVEEAQRLADASDEAGVVASPSTLAISRRRFRDAPALEHPSLRARVLVGCAERAPQPAHAGRPWLWGELVAAFGRAAKGAASSLVAVGEAGVGKTTLLDDAAALAGWKGLLLGRVSCGRFAAPAGGDDLRQLVASVARAVAADVAAPGDDVVDAARGLQRIGLSEGDQKRLRALLGSDEPVDELPLARRRTLLRASVLRFVRAVAGRCGLCLLVDDAERMDAPSRDLLTSALARLSGCRAVVIAVARPNLSPRFWPGVRRHAIEPLPEDAVLRAVRAALGDAEPGPRLSSYVLERAGGNPTLAGAIARLLATRLVLSRDGRACELTETGEALHLPETLSGVVQAQVALVPAPARVVLRRAALFGMEPPPRVPVDDGAAIESALREGGAAGLVVDAGPRALPRLSQPSLREALLEAPSPADADEQVHRALASSCALLGPDAARDALRLHHLLHAGLVDEAGEAALACARGAARVGLADAVVDLASRAVPLLVRRAKESSDDAFAARVVELAATVTEAQAVLEPTEAPNLVAALHMQVPPERAPRAWARALRQRGLALLRLKRIQDAEVVLDEALELAMAAGDPVMQATAQLDTAALLEAQGEDERAIALLTSAMTTLQGRPAEETRGTLWEVFLRLGLLLMRARRFDAARAAFTKTREVAGREDSLLGQAEAMGAFASLAANEGDVAAAVRCVDEGVRLADAAGDVIASVLLRQKAARRLAASGRVDEARGHLREALDIAAAVGWHDGQISSARALAGLSSAAPHARVASTAV